MKFNWKAIGLFIRRWAPVVAEAVISAKQAKKAEPQDDPKDDV